MGLPAVNTDSGLTPSQAAWSAGSEAEDMKELERERHRLISSNYAGTDPGAKYRDIAPGQGTGFDPTRYGSFEYQYDPKVGRIVKMPVGG